jgi:group I intron endonuclease
MKLIRVRNNKSCQTSGIYKIENYTNDKIYIGSSVNMSKRIFYEHLNSLRKGTHHSIVLQRHYNKYGRDDLFFTVVEIVPRLIRSNTRTQFGIRLKEREQHYLNILKPEFNMSKTAMSGFEIGKPHSEEHRKHLSENHADVSGKNHPNYKKGWNLGKKLRKEGEYKIPKTKEERREYDKKQYRKHHPQIIRDRSKRTEEEKKERKKEYNRKRYLKHPRIVIKKTEEEKKKYKREYYKNHKEYFKEYRLKNSDKNKEYQKNYRKSHKNKII